MKAKLTILGCGNSTGVPAAGNHWGSCDPSEPKNTRTRCSALVQSEKTTIVIDTGPDFRQHMNRSNVGHLDAVLYSHAHSDHMNGIDDLRVYVYRQKHKMPTYGSGETLADLESYFPYMFHGGKMTIYPPLLEPHEIKDFGNPMSVGDIECVPLQMDHESCMPTGYRFGNVAYCVDMLRLDAAAIKVLRGIETWIVDAAGYHMTDNKVHANLETIYALNKEVGAKKVFLTSLSLGMDYKTLCEELPEGYAPAYDGLEIEVIF